MSNAPDDLARWLRERGTFSPGAGRLEWAWEDVSPTLDPTRLAAMLCRFAAASSGQVAALALDAIADVVWWVSEIRGDIHAQPRVEGTAPWLEAFTDAVLDQPTFVRDCALAFTPQLPLGEQHYVDTRVDEILRRMGSAVVNDVATVAEDIAYSLEDRGSPPDAEKIWWAMLGGSVGTASRLVRYAEIASFSHSDRWRRPAVVALRAALVEATTEALVTERLPFWSRAWTIEHVARVDLRLLEDLVVHEQMPWLAAHMRHQLTLSAGDRQSRWCTWLVSP